MTPVTALELKFADGDYLFDLKLPQIAELQQKRGIGIFALYGRVLKGRFSYGDQPIVSTEHAEAYAEDLFETIRLGLIGGGRGTVDGAEIEVGANRARSLVEAYCHAAPLRESWAIAAAILAARIEGFVPPEGQKKSPDAPSVKPKRKPSTLRGRSETAPSSTSTGAS